MEWGIYPAPPVVVQRSSGLTKKAPDSDVKDVRTRGKCECRCRLYGGIIFHFGYFRGS
jgi:hypothetical protein